MENASKALLIAGSVLVVLILIGLGVLLINSTQDMTDQAQVSATAQGIQAFNSQFSQYNGEQKGSTIKTLEQTVNASNGANADSGYSVTLTYSDSDVNSSADLKNSTKYVVTTSDENNDGYIDLITVAKKTTP